MVEVLIVAKPAYSFCDWHFRIWPWGCGASCQLFSGHPVPVVLSFHLLYINWGLALKTIGNFAIDFSRKLWILFLNSKSFINIVGLLVFPVEDNLTWRKVIMMLWFLFLPLEQSAMNVAHHQLLSWWCLSVWQEFF